MDGERAVLQEGFMLRPSGHRTYPPCSTPWDPCTVSSMVSITSLNTVLRPLQPLCGIQQCHTIICKLSLAQAVLPHSILLQPQLQHPFHSCYLVSACLPMHVRVCSVKAFSFLLQQQRMEHHVVCSAEALLGFSQVLHALLAAVNAKHGRL